uniref:Uncharacterized protein n=1 Tax=viral metagenome TaxID=1070528 RepID=A0A6C0IEM2_9ZZZZ
MNNGENKLQEVQEQEQVPINDIKLVDVAIVDENTALNVIVSFVTLAHKRGAFSLDESAKIWECIKIFQKPI